MRILLLSMPNAIMAFQKASRFPNLGLCSLAGNLKSGHKVFIADLILHRGDLRKYIVKLLRKVTPDLVGMSCYSFQYDTAIKLAKMVKQVDTSVHTAIGGYHPTLRYDQIPEDEVRYIDFLIRHEGEFAFRDLVEALETGRDYSRIQGLSFKIDGEFHHSRSGPLLNLREISLPDRTCRILKGYHAWGLPCDVAETSRGCTFSCTFCTVIKMYGRHFRRYPMERIVRDLKNAKEMGARAIFLVDDNITLNMNHLEELCDAIVAAKLEDIHYITQASVHGISSSKRTVDKMAKAGFRTIFLGIENEDDSNLQFLGKDNQVNAEKAEKAVAYLKENGMIIIGAVIVGNPEDGEEDMWQSFHFLKRLNVDAPLFFNPTPLPKTQMREDMMKQEIVENPGDLSWYMGTKANAKTKYLSIEQVDRIVIEMNKAYPDFEFIRCNSIRKTYPKYFYKRIVSEIADAIRKKILIGIGVYDTDPLRIAIQRDMKRRENWLLEDLNHNCQCPHCSFGRGEDLNM